MPYKYFTFSVCLTHSQLVVLRGHLHTWTDTQHTGIGVHGDSNLHTHPDLPQLIGAVRCSHTHLLLYTERGMCVGAHLPANHAKIYITHTHMYNHPSIEIQAWAPIHLPFTWARAHTYTYRPNRMDLYAFRHSHVCTDVRTWHSVTGQVQLTSYRSRPFPTPSSYTKRLKPTILYEPCPGTHTYTHSTDLLAHTDTWLRLTATHRGRQAGEAMQAHTYTPT